jgi:thiol-disulfide isomerase/thioredoxin
MKTQSTRRRGWMVGVGALAGLAGLGLAWWRLREQPASVQAVQAFWERSFERLDGGTLAAVSLRGKPLLINFWATWCPPCVEELPMIEAFFRQKSARGVQVLALAIDQPSAVRRFLARQALTFPIGLAGLEGTELSRSFGNAAGGLPYSVFLNADGSIYKQKLGQLQQSDLDAWPV